MNIGNRQLRLFCCFALLHLAAFCVAAQNDEIYKLTADDIKNGKTVETNKLSWKFRVGDDLNWAAPAFDDGEWQIVNGTSLKLDALAQEEQSDWRGAGWFRLRFKTDESLRGKPLGLMIRYALGASEVYLDGELLRRFGEPGASGDADSSARFVNIYGTPFAVTLSDADEHTLAVRYRSVIEKPETAFSRWIYTGGGDGFYLYFTDINEAVARREQTQHSSATTAVARAGIYLAVGLLHLLLFWFYPQQRANLYFGLYAFLTAVSNFIGHAQSASGATDLTTFVVYRTLFRFLFLSYSLAFLLFLYHAFLPRVPRFVGFAAALWVIANIVTLLFPGTSFSSVLFSVMTIAFVSECLRVMWLAVRRGAEGAWIVAAGVLTALLGPLRYLYLAAGLTIPKDFDFYLGFVSSYGMLAAVSIYLARRFAGTNRDLAEQLDNVRELSAQALQHERTEAELRLKHEKERAENERRAKELEEARALQLSMLPKTVPQLPNLKIAAYMKPATEVGGDYYDFHISPDGTLTVAVGDATGHGLKAGTVVTATKGLFNNLAHAPDIPDTFRQISRSLKAMNLRGLFMAMTMLKIKDNRFSISAAGMPSTLVYRAATEEIEEIKLRAVPLGSLAAVEYREQEFALAENDCIILMSDGFTEMFNEAGEMLGDGEANRILTESANLSPQEIINRFVKVGEDWAGARPQDDDVTFVVLKVKTKNAL